MINVVKEINQLLDYAIKNFVSDIHIEAIKDGLKIRYRKDGVLKIYKKYGIDQRAHYLSRVKVMAELDINSYVFQDGRFTYQDVDIRVSVLPVYWGEKIVLRLLIKDKKLLDIANLGMDKKIENQIKKQIEKTSGLILLTGPTGSGKTTTLYSILRLLDSEQKNITTIEDPVEYQLENINQVQVNEKMGIGFISFLEAVLRQDPDIIFVGEIRSNQTAAIAVRAALTGHLVFATLHTGNPQETIVRLKDLGVEEYLLKNTINCILSQKLERKKCSACHGQGCAKCNDEGFCGRLGLFEYLDFNS